MTKPHLTGHEWALCIAALDHAAKDLREGVAAAARLGGIEGQDVLAATAEQMQKLKDRLWSGSVGEAVRTEDAK